MFLLNSVIYLKYTCFMKKIFAIGWWEIWTGKLFQDNADACIDSEMLRLLWEEDPRIAFIPWCWRDDIQWYCDKFKKFFIDNFSLTPKSLESIYDEMTGEEFVEETKDIDLLYIWGWNTVEMLKIFKEKGIDKRLKELYENWVMMAWVSAWAICWFEYWVTDSHPTKKPYGEMEALWFVEWICCPHYDSESERKEILEELVEEYGKKWYGIPDGCALYIENGVVQFVEWDGKSIVRVL